MNKSINLLPQKSAGYFRERKIISILRIVSFLALFALFVAAVSVFFLNRYYSPSNLSGQEEQAMAKNTAVNQKMVKYLYAQDRLKDIKSIVEKRANLDKVILQITQNVPEGITIDGITVTKENVTLSLSSSSLKLSEQVLDTFASLGEKKKLFKSVTLDGLSIGSSGKHNLSVKASLL